MDPSRPLFQQPDFISSIYLGLSQASALHTPPAALAGHPAAHASDRHLSQPPILALLTRIPDSFGVGGVVMDREGKNKFEKSPPLFAFSPWLDCTDILPFQDGQRKQDSGTKARGLFPLSISPERLNQNSFS